MAIQVYVDDSDTALSAERPVFVLAGWAARPARWDVFSRKWQRCLDARPTIPYFKMRDAWSFRDHWFGLDKPERDTKLHALATIIRDYAICGMHFRMLNSDWREVVRHFGMVNLQEAAYTFGLYRFIDGVLRIFYDLGIREPIDFIFDEKQRAGDMAESVWGVFAADVPPELRPLLGARPIHRDDKRERPLQAADMLAWHVRRDISSGGKPGFTPAGPIFQVKQYQVDFDPKDLSGYFEHALKKLPSLKRR